jgi:hypothetical protein
VLSGATGIDTVEEGLGSGATDLGHTVADGLGSGATG